MAFNGSGQFNRVHDWTTDAAAAVPISATRMDAEDDGFATGLSTCIAKDGQTNPTANLPMNNFKHTGVANATARTHYTAAGQTQDGGLVYGTVGGTADAITLTLTPAITAYAAGQVFRFTATGSNTGAVTVNVSALGIKSITKDGTAALVANDIKNLDAVEIQYDGTQFQLVSASQRLSKTGGTVTGTTTFSAAVGMSAAAFNTAIRVDVASAATVDLDAAVSNYIRITGTTTITAITLTDGRWRDVVFGGALTLTNGASLILEGGANILTVAGDTCRMHGEASGVVRVKDYRRGAVRPLEGGGRLTATRYYTAGDTWTKPANLDFVIVEGIGGGGGGGNALANDTCGGGGGGGGYSKKKVSAASLGATETVTIGAGGSGGGPGGTGGTTSFGAHITASGGVGGAATGGNGGAGGSGSSGDLNINGGSGARGLTLAGASGGIGGNTVQGGGGGGGAPDANGSIGGNYGGGGGGAARVVTNRTGGTGAAGLVIVYEYSL